MNINENYEYPSELQDSFEEKQFEIEMPQRHPLQINKIDHFYINSSRSQNEQDFNTYQDDENKINIEPSIDSSFQNDDLFLKNIKQEINRKQMEKQWKNEKEVGGKLFLDRSKLKLTLLATDEHKESVLISNPSKDRLTVQIKDCPFVISCMNNLNLSSSNAYEFVIEAWQSLAIVFHVAKKEDQLGDVYQTVPINVFTNQTNKIDTLYLHFQVHFVIPKFKLIFFGQIQTITTQHNILITKIKANKLGQYVLQITMNGGLKSLECSIETRGKISVFPDNLKLYDNDSPKLNIRQTTPTKNNEKSALIIRPHGTKLCYVFGIEFIQ